MSDAPDRAHGDAVARETDASHDALRLMQLGRPDPALRRRTLSAVRAVLEATSAPEPTWRAWRIELSLAAAIAACVLLVPAADQLPAESPSSAPANFAALAGDELLLEPLELNDLEPYIRYRLDLAGRHPDPKPERRYTHHELSSRDLDLL